MSIETFSARAYCLYGYIFYLPTLCRLEDAVSSWRCSCSCCCCWRLLVPHGATCCISALRTKDIIHCVPWQSAGHAALQSAIAVNNASSYMSPSSWPLAAAAAAFRQFPYQATRPSTSGGQTKQERQRVRVNDEGRLGHCGLVSCVFCSCYQQTLSLLLKCRGL